MKTMIDVVEPLRAGVANLQIMLPDLKHHVTTRFDQVPPMATTIREMHDTLLLVKVIST
jgi:hypothetical protein